jgi:hypothetical protein
VIVCPPQEACFVAGADTPATDELGFVVRPISGDEIRRLVCPDLGTALREALAATIQVFAAHRLPWSHGRHRIAFRRGLTVAKIPLSLDGVHANAMERAGFRKTLAGQAYCPVAACRMWLDHDGIPILLMRTVVPVSAASRPEAWVLSVDCGQVGHDPRGRLVAYDL